MASDGQWRFPGAGELNDKFTQALIESEDRRFRYHPGVDPLAIGRAMVLNLRRGRVVSGASTLTMQTIRLSRGTRRRTLPEKALEAVLALRLELGTSKDEILALYAANAPFGANVVGLEAATWRWFGRSSASLSWAEAATLAILPNSPALIHPGRNREALKVKRDNLLEKLFARRCFDAETLNLSRAEALPGEPLPLPRRAPHLLDRLIREEAEGGLRRGSALSPGTKDPAPFVTTLDAEIQERAQTIMNRAVSRFAENGIMNGAGLIINTQTGETLAYVGNADTPFARDVDIVNAPRSSGSLLKPFLYAAMLDTGDILPSSLVSDIPTRVGSYSPENITRTYLGVVPADEALARSLNIPAVRSLRVYGVDRFARLLRNLGLSTLFRPGDDYGLPLILGGAEVTLWEMTGLYAGLGRTVSARDDKDGGEGPGAVFFPPRVFPKEEAGKGSPGKPVQGLPISPGAAWLTLEALVSAIRPGEEAVWQEYASSRRIAWKTGTSFGFRDAWAVGVTPEWTVGVWIGNASGEGRAELRSALTSAPVLFELFSALYSGGGRGTWFPQPAAELRSLELCAASGFPAGPHCETVRIGDAPRNAPAGRVCSYCRAVLLNQSLDRRLILWPGTSEGGVERKWFVLPPAEEWYYRRWNLDYKPLPPEADGPGQSGPLGGSSRDIQSLALFNPEPGGQVYVPRELDGSEGRVVFSAALREADGVIYWHLDNQYLGLTRVFHEMEARPPPGPHTLTLVDSRGNTLTRNFTVIDRAE